MSEMRWNPFLRQWVVTATHRQDRTYKPPKEYCPLCPTAPGAFPTEVPADEYEIVVFENRFPSFRHRPAGAGRGGHGALPRAPGARASARWSSTPKTTTRRCRRCRWSTSTAWSQVWTDRYVELGSREEIEYVLIFENKGEAVGVTLHHPHGQIYAFPVHPAHSDGGDGGGPGAPGADGAVPDLRHHRAKS